MPPIRQLSAKRRVSPLAAAPSVLVASRLTEQLRLIEMARRYRMGQAVSEFTRRIDPFGQKWAVNVRVMIARGQLSAANEAIGYANAYARTMGGTVADLAGAISGVDQGFGKANLGPTIRRYQMLANKVMERDGPEAAKVWLERRMKRAASDLTWMSGRDTLQAAIALHPDMRGYRRIASPMACGACLALATGVVLPPWEAFRDHPHCRCSIEPVIKGAPLVQRPNGRAYFDALSDKDQNDLLGPEKAELLRSGQIGMNHLIGSPKGGIGRRKLVTETPLNELLELAPAE